MSSKYDGLSPQEADDLLRGTIGSIVCEALGEARGMSRKAWNNRDIFDWSYQVSGMIAVAIENRRNCAP